MSLNEPTPAAGGDARSLHEHAIKNIELIRSTMQRAGAFTAVSGTATMLMGVTACVATFLAARQPQQTGALFIWLGEAVLAAAIAVFAMALKSRQAGIPLFAGPGRRFLLGLCPPLFAGMILTLVFYQQGTHRFIRPMWLLLYGTGVATGGAFSVRLIPAMGLCFMLFGAAGFLLPLPWHEALMAAGFGGLHLIFGFIIMRKYHG